MKDTRPNRTDEALAERVADPGYTPALRDAGSIAALLANPDEAVVDHAARALLRLAPLGSGAWEALARLADDPRPPVRAGIVDALAQIDAARTLPVAIRALGDGEAAVRRRAIAALGRAPASVALDAERALLAAYEAAGPAHRRAIVAALGKIGHAATREFLRALKIPAGDPELLRLVQQARARVERDEVRKEPSHIVGDRRLADEIVPFTLTYLTRRGLEPLLTEELNSHGHEGARIVGEGQVSLPWRGTLDEALAAARTAFAISLPLADVSAAPDDLHGALVQALTGDDARARLRGFTDGPVRFRLSIDGKGHRRALVWKVAGALAASAETSWLINDAQQAPWEAHLSRIDGDAAAAEETYRLDLRPRALVDSRFAYRQDDVPAASHPPLAAALARIAGVRGEDVVWDPFAGSGTELIERAKLGPYAHLFGSDREPKAIDAMRANVRRAKVERITLLQSDVFESPPPDVTVILTNPPMGRRVTGVLDLSTLLDRFIVRAAEVLVRPGSRLVWISPQPRRTRTRAEAEGLTLARAVAVDMGGFDAEIQRFDRL